MKPALGLLILKWKREKETGRRLEVGGTSRWYGAETHRRTGYLAIIVKAD